MINSRSFTDLTPETAAKCVLFQQECAAAGVPIIFTSTYRDIEAQNAIYAEGRTRPGTIKTKARGGDSYHQYRVAADFVPVRDRKPIWGEAHLWEMAGAIAEKCGLEWGGNWPHFKDRPHVQNTGGKTIKQFKAEAK